MPRACNLRHKSVCGPLVLLGLCFLIAGMPLGASAEEEEGAQVLAATILGAGGPGPRQHQARQQE